MAIVAVGIDGNVEDLGLEALGVKIDRGHVVIDSHGATNVPGLYAIGDVAGPPWLAHKASHEGVHCVEHIAGLKPNGLNAPIPGCTYAQPQVASVGLTEAAAKAKGLTVKVGRFPFRVNGKAIAAGETEGFVKTVFDAATGALVGRPYDRRRSYGNDSGFRPGHDPGGDRGRTDGHGVPAPDHERGHARGGAGRLRPGAAPVALR